MKNQAFRQLFFVNSRHLLVLNGKSSLLNSTTPPARLPSRVRFDSLHMSQKRLTNVRPAPASSSTEHDLDKNKNPNPINNSTTKKPPTPIFKSLFFQLNLLSNRKKSPKRETTSLRSTKSATDAEQTTVIDLKVDNKRKEIGFETESILDNSWKEVKIEYDKLFMHYSKLAKKNLTALVVCTTMMGCVMAPVPFDPYIFAVTTVGTTLTSIAANTINQFLEVPYDSQMNRTKDRVLVRGHLTPLHAFTFASISGLAGVSMLYFLANPLTAALGASTLFLYTAVYTPMKRLSALNTWVGSIVGAIPPLMGWTAMTGQLDATGCLLAAILYSWQFPHFHALSWNLRSEYSRAGYRMIAVLNPRICTSSALSHTVALLAMCSLGAPLLELTTWNFAIDSLPFSLYFIYLAGKFKQNGDAQSSRKLFRYSLVYLPLIILLMLITKHPTKEAQENLDIRSDLIDASTLSTNSYLAFYNNNKKNLSNQSNSQKVS